MVYEDWMIEELRKCQKDPVHFLSTYVKIDHPTKGRVAFDPYPYQQEALLDFEQNKFNILLAARQLGTTTIEIGYALWKMVFEDHKTILFVGKRNADAQEYIRILRDMFESLPVWLRPKIQESNKRYLHLSNGCRALGAICGGDTARGMAVSLLIWDAAAYVAQRHAVDFVECAFPVMLGGHHTQIIISSCAGDKNTVFQTLCEKAGEKLSPFNLTRLEWDAIPGRGAEFKERMQSLMSDQQWRQEYMCEFVSSVN